MQKRIKFYSIILFALVIYINYLANTLPIGGITTGQASDALPNLFTPIGFTFSIWGLIYFCLSVFCVIIFFIPKIYHDNYFLILKLFNINCLLNILWIFAWHYRYIFISFLIMMALLLTLIFISKAFQKIKSKKGLEYKIIFSTVAFDIYFAWIVVATVANFTALLVFLKWGGWNISHEMWTTIIIALITILSSYIFIKNNSPAFILTVLWAIYGIYAKHTSIFFDDNYPLVINTALVSMTSLFVILVLKISKSFLKR